MCVIFFFNDTATTEIYTLSLHDALPISMSGNLTSPGGVKLVGSDTSGNATTTGTSDIPPGSKKGGGASSETEVARSEEHTSELQSRQYLVCRLLLEKKKVSQTLCLSRSS